MSIRLRILCWNIAEGRADDPCKIPNSLLSQLADVIRSKSPHIVLLNEGILYRDLQPTDYCNGTKDYEGETGVNQVQRLGELSRMVWRHWTHAARLGPPGVGRGFKAIGILSNIEVGGAQRIPVVVGGKETDYVMLRTVANVNNLAHHLISLRFDSHAVPDNAAGHQQLIDLVKRFQAPVIVGGDFNSQPTSPQFLNFVRTSGLTNAAGPNDDSIDHIFFRGPYRVTAFERIDRPDLSDHMALYAELLDPRPDVKVPEVREVRWGDAGAAIRNAGLVPQRTVQSPPDGWVWTQSPDGGDLVRPGSTVTCQLRTESPR